MSSERLLRINNSHVRAPNPEDLDSGWTRVEKEWVEEEEEGNGVGWEAEEDHENQERGFVHINPHVVSVALALLTGSQAGKEKHEMNIQKLLVCSEM
ncbi:hypothetical protein KM043_016047 [Ampulex compressa]|nr:hypothetical protein KM043_016047 [Ampulex compressa]